MDKVIEIRDLSFKYPDGKLALKNINLDIYNGESVAIIGPNGAGKSTLLLHLNGIFYGSGNVKILGMQAIKENIKEIRKKVGLVFQEPDDQLFMPTVFDDVAFGPLNMRMSKEEVLTRVKDALAKVGMSNYEERFSHHLSVGEKKRIAIATVLSMEPQILVLDEPTSNLDPRAKREIIKLLNSINITKIIASHDLQFVLNVCSRVVILNNGEKIIEGKTIDILRNEPVLLANGLEMPLSLKNNQNSHNSY